MYRWVPILGEFQLEGETLIFKGGETVTADGRPVPNLGNFVCDQYFGGGTISAKIEFREPPQKEACELILYYHPPIKTIYHGGPWGRWVVMCCAFVHW